MTTSVDISAARTIDGLAAHREAVGRLRGEYRRLPPHAPVRLAKRTSNLFRFRAPATAPGLDVSAFDRVLVVDPATRTAEVGGMTTYEDLVAATLPHGLMPLVVPQLRTITLGGAVTGLGIESSSFRNGLPHESVIEMEILTGDGQVVVARADNEHSDLYRGFPNSYGTLGYALRLRIELEEVRPFVRLQHLRFDDPESCAAAIADVCASGLHDSAGVDFVDATMFGLDELYLTVGRFADDVGEVSDYTGMRVYYRSLQQRSHDSLTVHDYLWRWDTDWFWCSRAFGVQRPSVRRLVPRRYLRSETYWRLVSLDQRHGFSRRLDRVRGRPRRENVIQDVEIPVERTAEFLRFLHRRTGMTPVWLCPVRLRGGPWPLYPMEPGRLYVNVGFWGTVPLGTVENEGDHNRAVEREVARLGGHKSLYSTSCYDESEFWRLYDGGTYRRLKAAYDRDGRLLDLYDKCVHGR